jgi:hypothetical protein
MLIDYVVFGTLVIVALAATFVGTRRRRADRLSGDLAVPFPFAGDGSTGTNGTHHSGHSDFGGSDGGGGAHEGGPDGGGGSDGGGGFDGGGGHHH